MANREIERNLRLLPAFEAGRYALFWLPIFFLYFSSVLPLEQVLLLEGVYYLGTVLLEVPSGWFSDRIGRRVTLLIAMAAQLLGCSLFFLSSSFVPFLLAQVCFSVSAAFVSGTNHALLYDSLRELGREPEIGIYTQTLVSRGFLALAFSSLLGGFFAGFDLRIAYALTAVSSLVALVLAWRLVEPQRRSDATRPGPAMVLRNLRQRPLAWVFLFAVSMTVFDHVPYEFVQPYIGLLMADLGQGSYTPTPAASGAMFCAIMLLSAWSATRSIALSDLFGSAAALLFAMALQGAIIAGMMLFLHPAVLLLVAFRSVPQGLAYPIQSAIVQPRIAGEVRATYLSVQSLAGSLAFSGSLLLASRAVGGRELSWELMSRLLFAYGAGLAVVLVLLFTASSWLRDERS